MPTMNILLTLNKTIVINTALNKSIVINADLKQIKNLVLILLTLNKSKI